MSLATVSRVLNQKGAVRESTGSRVLASAQKLGYEMPTESEPRSAEGGLLLFSIRNISQEELNIPPEELMERFVRGDRSRHTEGNGLGLSIAKFLVELQGGSFKLEILGDLFTASLNLPVARCV